MPRAATTVEHGRAITAPTGEHCATQTGVVRTSYQGDYVVTIWQEQPDPNRPGETYLGHAFDMYRLENGLIMEHWDDTRKWPRSWSEEKPA